MSLEGSRGIWRYSPAEARVAVATAVEARRARPLLKVPLGRVLDTSTTLGLLVAMAIVGIGIYEFIKGSIGLILGIVALILTGATGLASVPHNMRASRLWMRRARVAKAFDKAMTRPGRLPGDTQTVTACKRAILEGDFVVAAGAVFCLFDELAGTEALQEEVVHERLPVWPAYLCFRALRATSDDQIAQDRELLLEQTFATSHPLWATVAACKLLDSLDPVTDEARVRELTEWVTTVGDRGAAIECIFYK